MPCLWLKGQLHRGAPELPLQSRGSSPGAWSCPLQASPCATSHPRPWKRRPTPPSATSLTCTGGTRGCTRRCGKARGSRALSRSGRWPREQPASAGRRWASSASVRAAAQPVPHPLVLARGPSRERKNQRPGGGVGGEADEGIPPWRWVCRAGWGAHGSKGAVSLLTAPGRGCWGCLAETPAGLGLEWGLVAKPRPGPWARPSPWKPSSARPGWQQGVPEGFRARR